MIVVRTTNPMRAFKCRTLKDAFDYAAVHAYRGYWDLGPWSPTYIYQAGHLVAVI